MNNRGSLPMPTTNKRGSAQSILIVDDDETFRTRLARAFTDRGYEVRVARRRTAAAARAARRVARAGGRGPADAGPLGLELVRELVRIDPATQDRRADRLRQHRDRDRGGAPRRDLLSARSRPTSTTSSPRSRATGRRRSSRSAATHVAPSLARAEWEHINRVLADCGGNISEAARRLGIHRRSLQRKLQKYPPAD